MSIIIPTLLSLGASVMLAILGYVIRIARQQARMLQYFVHDSPISEHAGGTIPRRLQVVENDLKEVYDQVEDIRLEMATNA